MRSRRLALAVLVALAGLACTTTRPAESPIDTAVRVAQARCQCRLGVAARHLESGRSFSYNGGSEFEAASVIKIAVITEAMAAVREGRVDLAERWTLTEENKADGSGTLLMLDAGLNPTWDDLTTLMIGPSDNTATNAWIERLGIDAINGRMAALGFRQVRLFSPLPLLSRAHDDPSSWKGFRLGSVSPREITPAFRPRNSNISTM